MFARDSISLMLLSEFEVNGDVKDKLKFAEVVSVLSILTFHGAAQAVIRRHHELKNHPLFPDLFDKWLLTDRRLHNFAMLVLHLTSPIAMQ